MPEPIQPDPSGESSAGASDSQEDMPTLDPHAFLFGRYQVERELGRGGMGVVLLARDTKLQQSVAIKMIPDLVVKDAEAIDDLRKEVLRGMTLMHPGIVRTHYFERDDTRAAIVMEFIDGHTLAELKRKQPGHCFDCGQILPWIEQLCTVLDYAHREAMIVHRDLKPRNVMINVGGKLKVADFGMAASLNESISRVSAQEHASGTPPYMSPQQARGASPNALDDIHALGATVYELLTSKPPFFRGNIIFQVIEQVPPSMAERRLELNVADKQPIPPEWERAVASCLAKEPADRPQNGAAFIAMLHGRGPAPANVPPPRRPAAPSNPRPAEPGSTEDAPTVAAPRVPPLDAAPKREILPWIAGTVIAVAGIAGGLFLSERRAHERPSVQPTPVPSAKATQPVIPAPPILPSLPAMKDQPWENSLGMHFVPVPIVGGPTAGQQVSFSVWETRIKEYEQFVRATRRDWEKREFSEGPMHPAVHISWDDAVAFCAWLTEREQRTGKLPGGLTYRLPSDHEWSCAVGIGGREDPLALPRDKDAKLAGVYPWGNQWPPAAKAGNYADASGVRARNGYSPIGDYDDGFPFTSPAGSFPPNAVGLYDLSGNAWEWCNDWYDDAQKFKVLRGGAWTSGGHNFLLSSFRNVNAPIGHSYYYGFRCVVAPVAR